MSQNKLNRVEEFLARYKEKDVSNKQACAFGAWKILSIQEFWKRHYKQILYKRLLAREKKTHATRGTRRVTSSVWDFSAQIKSYQVAREKKEWAREENAVHSTKRNDPLTMTASTQCNKWPYLCCLLLIPCHVYWRRRQSLRGSISCGETWKRS